MPSPACRLLRGDREHLFIVLCIIDHSKILITSFPQDSSETVYLIIIGDYPVLRTLDSYLSTSSDFPRPPFHVHSFYLLRPRPVLLKKKDYRTRLHDLRDEDSSLDHYYLRSRHFEFKVYYYKRFIFLIRVKDSDFFHTSLEMKVTTILTYSH